MFDPGELWRFLFWGYLLTVLLETPVLMVGLSPPHSMRRRFWSGLWLTACTFPIVVLVLPFLVWEPFGRTAYLIAAETFAPTIECLVFYFAFLRGSEINSARRRRDLLVIVAANLLSFLAAELMRWLGWIS